MFRSDKEDCARMLEPIIYQAIRDYILIRVSNTDRESAAWFLFNEDGLDGLIMRMPKCKMFDMRAIRDFAVFGRRWCKRYGTKKPVHEKLLIGLARKWEAGRGSTVQIP